MKCAQVSRTRTSGKMQQNTTLRGAQMDDIQSIVLGGGSWAIIAVLILKQVWPILRSHAAVADTKTTVYADAQQTILNYSKRLEEMERRYDEAYRQLEQAKADLLIERQRIIQLEAKLRELQVAHDE